MAASPQRLLHLPIASHKAERGALLAVLPAALAFVAAHVPAGRAVLLACETGLDRGVGLALAALLGLYAADCSTWLGPPQGGFLPGPGGGVGATSCTAEATATAISNGGRPPAGKAATRRVLALLAAAHPEARPARGTLKQVSLFFAARPCLSEEDG